MAITDPTTIDAMGIDKITGEVVLTISDHLDWEDERGHLSLLEEKINAYLGYLESGQIQEDVPEASGRQPKIAVYIKFSPPEHAKQVLRKVGQGLAGHGIAFSFGELPSGF